MLDTVACVELDVAVGRARSQAFRSSLDLPLDFVPWLFALSMALLAVNFTSAEVAPLDAALAGISATGVLHAALVEFLTRRVPCDAEVGAELGGILEDAIRAILLDTALGAALAARRREVEEVVGEVAGAALPVVLAR